MGTTKTSIHTLSQIKFAEFAKVLGHPARIAILQYLVEHPSCVCGSIVEEIGLAQATISQHLKALKEIGLIQGTVEGTSVCYCINPSIWKEAQLLFQDFFNTDLPNNTCC